MFAKSVMTSTVMAGSNQSVSGHLKGTNDRRVGDNETIIPDDTKNEPLPTAVLHKLILVLVPMFSQGMGILEPGLLTDDGLHKQFYATDISREWSEHRWEGILAFQGIG